MEKIRWNYYNQKSSDGFKSKSDTTKEHINELEDESIENSQNGPSAVAHACNSRILGG